MSKIRARNQLINKENTRIEEIVGLISDFLLNSDVFVWQPDYSTQIDNKTFPFKL